MSYFPTWSNGNPQGRVDAGCHSVRLSDGQELAAGINRRRLLVYQSEQQFSSHLQSGAYLRKSTVATSSAPPFDSFRLNLTGSILSPSVGGLGGTPPTPAAMDWLWPISGADENKVLVSGAGGVEEGQVGLLQKINGTGHWTDPTLLAGQTPIRAVHFNELRQAIEWIRRGRWRLPIYLAAGIFSALPETPWTGGGVANNGTDELRALGYAVVRLEETPSKGLNNATVRSASGLKITADSDCTVGAYHCLRPVDWQSDPPTWNEYDPSADETWATAGGFGAEDSTYLGSVDLEADQPGVISNSSLSAALQAMINGSRQHFLFCRADTGTATVGLTAEVTVEFDIDTPPN